MSRFSDCAAGTQGASRPPHIGGHAKLGKSQREGAFRPGVDVQDGRCVSGGGRRGVQAGGCWRQCGGVKNCHCGVSRAALQRSNSMPESGDTPCGARQPHASAAARPSAAPSSSSTCGPTAVAPARDAATQRYAATPLRRHLTKLCVRWRRWRALDFIYG